MAHVGHSCLNAHAQACATQDGWQAVVQCVPCCLLLQCFRLSCTVQDGWVKLVKETRDEDWAMQDIVNMLCGRRWALAGMHLTGRHAPLPCMSAPLL